MPSSSSFADQTVGSTSAPNSLILTNSGSANLSLGTPSISGANASDFSISRNTCSSSVATGANCEIDLTFTPGAAGSRLATLVIPSNAASSPDSVSLSGNGVAASGGTGSGSAPPSGTILFVTQVPVVQFQSVVSSFGAQQASLQQVPRGGDLYLRYPDGTLRNLTSEAGYGLPSGPQNGPKAIAVRQPVVYWDGTKAMFSMLVGGASQQYQVNPYNWQLYEVTGLAAGQKAVITKLSCQPEAYNNIAPVYDSDGNVIFTSDQPRNGASYLYPQLDEYEGKPIETGLWKIDLKACRYKLLEHTVSGATYPKIDHYGRLVFTRWDHLQRDQEADLDKFSGQPARFGAFNYASEAEDSNPQALPNSTQENFPELRDPKYSSADGQSVAPGYPYNGFGFNQFFPWMLRQDGSTEETLNHVGHHELGGAYTQGNFASDPNLQGILFGKYNNATYFLYGSGGAFHLQEDPTVAGRYYAVSSPEFASETGGDLIYIDGPPGIDPDQMKVTLVGDSSKVDSNNQPVNGLFRNPLPMSDGSLVVAHTLNAGLENNTGSEANPVYNYSWRLRTVAPGASAGSVALGPTLTAGISKTVIYWDPDTQVTWSGNLWELDPVEVRSRAVPAKTVEDSLPSPEQQILSSQGVDENLLKYWMKQNALALIVSRNVTTRDRSDLQQPFNLIVSGTSTQENGSPPTPQYSISHLQIFEADQIRGYTTDGQTPQNGGTPQPGRRPLAEFLNDPASIRAMGSAFQTGLASVPIATDGSVAAFVPALRAVTWALIDSAKTDWSQTVVRERNWLSFKPGERRVCTSCHGINTADQAGKAEPQNPPLALGTLLTSWKSVVRKGCAASGGTGSWSYSGVSFSACDDGQQFEIQTCQNGNGCCDGLPQYATQACQ